MMELEHHMEYGAGRDDSDRNSVEELLQSILDLTKSMERSTESEDFDKVTQLMGHRESLLGEYSGLHRPGEQAPGSLQLIKAIDRENSVLLAQLQQKRDLIAERLANLRKEKAIAHYRH
ncbi:MAG TPA: hypothetical protein VMG09_06380 [Bacteroidota bacterium]|nr:hypothetical protein [Bacteroidota bacterium]